MHRLYRENSCIYVHSQRIIIHHRFIVPLRTLVNDRSDVLHQEAAGLMPAAAIFDLVEGSRTEPRTEREVSNDLTCASGTLRTSAECLMGDRDPKPGGSKVAVAVASRGSALGSPEVALVVAKELRTFADDRRGSLVVVRRSTKTEH
nr:hypothetical protein Iba_chr09bCG11980 [Ipomoea batatas]